MSGGVAPLTGVMIGLRGWTGFRANRPKSSNARPSDHSRTSSASCSA
jgi:hypothetical protein